MLTWTQQDDAWYAEGFRIVRYAPYRWVLTEPDPDSDPEGLINLVAPALQPLATARTLSEAKREAELRDASRRRVQLRRRHVMILLLAVAATVLALGESAVFNVGLIFAATYVALRSIGFILGTLFWRSAGSAKEVAFYQ
ncbi:MAG: hypothetical protein GY926_17870 [bacterium]|nr:hypothetical protein [bacterium]